MDKSPVKTFVEHVTRSPLTYVCLQLLHLDRVLHELPLLVDLPLTKENQRVLG